MITQSTCLGVQDNDLVSVHHDASPLPTDHACLSPSHWVPSPVYSEDTEDWLDKTNKELVGPGVHTLGKKVPYTSALPTPALVF